MFGEVFSDFEHDPFFDFGHRPQQQQQQLQLSGRSHSMPRDQLRRQRSRPHQAADAAGVGGAALVPRVPAAGHRNLGLPGYSFGLPQFDRLFEGVGRLMADAGGQMREAQAAAQREDFNGHVYSHSAVYAYSSHGGGEPHVYQAVSETRAGPGGVREIRRALKDSRTREEKVAVGHHIGGRGHTVERRRNGRTGDQQEDHHYAGIDESEGEHFDREWDARAAGLAGWADSQQRQRGHRHGDRRLAGGGGSSGRRAITDGGKGN